MSKHIAEQFGLPGVPIGRFWLECPEFPFVEEFSVPRRSWRSRIRVQWFSPTSDAAQAPCRSGVSGRKIDPLVSATLSGSKKKDRK